jgi:hypothetical protein
MGSGVWYIASKAKSHPNSGSSLTSKFKKEWRGSKKLGKKEKKIEKKVFKDEKKEEHLTKDQIKMVKQEDHIYKKLHETLKIQSGSNDGMRYYEEVLSLAKEFDSFLMDEIESYREELVKVSDEESLIFKEEKISKRELVKEKALESSASFDDKLGEGVESEERLKAKIIKLEKGEIYLNEKQKDIVSKVVGLNQRIHSILREILSLQQKTLFKESYDSSKSIEPLLNDKSNLLSNKEKLIMEEISLNIQIKHLEKKEKNVGKKIEKEEEAIEEGLADSEDLGDLQNVK